MANAGDGPWHRLSLASGTLKLRSPSLRLQLVLSVLGMTLFAALMFGFLTLLFAHSVEDSLFEQELIRQGKAVQQNWVETGRLSETGSDYISVYREPSLFPADLRKAFAADPDHREFRSDDGSHYQVLEISLPGTDESAWLAADLNGRQVVPDLHEKMIRFFVSTTAIIMLLVASMGWLLASRLTAPLTRLAQNVSAQDRHEVPAVTGSDYPGNEVGRLAIALESAFERIEAFVARERGFTRDVSHELRTPLAVIRGGVELIENQPDLPKRVTAPLARIRQAERRMTETVQLLLMLAREEGQNAPREQVALAPIVEAAVLAASDRFGGRDRAVTVDIPPEAAASLNRAGFLMILDNLISNAFEHAPAHALRIALEERSLMIASGGPGMPARIAASAGKPFARGTDSEGVGLGLSIVRRLCVRDEIPLSLGVSEQGTVVRLDLRCSSDFTDSKGQE